MKLNNWHILNVGVIIAHKSRRPMYYCCHGRVKPSTYFVNTYLKPKITAANKELVSDMFANIILSTRLTCCAPSWRYSRSLFILKEGTGSRLYVFPLGHSLDEAPEAPQHLSTKTVREKNPQKSHTTLTSHNSRPGEAARPHLDSNYSSAPAGIT